MMKMLVAKVDALFRRGIITKAISRMRRYSAMIVPLGVSREEQAIGDQKARHGHFPRTELLLRARNMIIGLMKLELCDVIHRQGREKGSRR
jgi:hypothetical protein